MNIVKRNMAASALVALTLGGLALTLGLAGGGDRSIEMRPTVAVPAPVYDVEAVSGAHRASVLNLPLGQPGVVQAPTPVDVDGNLLPDVEVAVNLVNAEGIFHNPPQPGDVLAPNIEINRLPSAPLLGQGTPPLRINVKLRIVDAGTSNPDTIVRFGYETGPGGSIPPEFKLVAGGLANAFNPFEARIESTGGLLVGLDPGVPDLGLGPATAGPGGNAYEGPLTIVAAVDAAELDAAVDVRLSPLPDLVGLTYGTDDAGQHITVSHNTGVLDDVDMDIDGTVSSAQHVEIEPGQQRHVRRTVELDARVDRLPNRVALDIAGGDTTGAVHYVADGVAGRLPDARVTVHKQQEGIGADRDDAALRNLVHADVDLEAIPADIRGAWSLPAAGQAGLVALDFDADGAGIGAVEARVANYDGEPVAFTPWRPSHRQYASIQAGPGGLLEGETLVLARLERIRHASLHETAAGGLEGELDVGDGEQPIELHTDLDLRATTGVALDATSTVAPLPDHLTFGLTPAGEDQSIDPLRVAYTASEAVDVDLDARVALAGTEPGFPCGGPDTFCADVAIRNIPTSIEARLVRLGDEVRLEVDDVPRAGGAPVDVFVDALVGPLSFVDVPDFGLLAAPVRAHLDLQGVPAHIRLRAVDGAAQTFERVEFHACDRDFDANECRLDADGKTTAGEVAEVAFRINNFEQRPANLPAPTATEPEHVTVTGRGVEGTNALVHFEASGRLTDIAEFQYLNVDQLLGVRVDAAGGQTFRALVDVDDFDVDGGDPNKGRIDFDADVTVDPLPTPANFCLGAPGRAPSTTPTDPITAPCENVDPFGDGPVSSLPLAFAYRTGAGSPFDASIKASLSGDLPFELPELPIGFEEFDRVAADVVLDNIPGDFTAYVQTPAGDASTTSDGLSSNGVRLLTIAPGANDLSMTLSAELSTPGDDCADARLDGSLVCADVVVDGLPEYASILADTVTEEGAAPGGGDALRKLGVEFHACDRDFYGSGTCRPGTAGDIAAIDADVRVHAGKPSGVRAYPPPATTPHVVALADIESLDDLEAMASVHLEGIRAVTFHQGPDGIDVATDIGNGTKPLKVYAEADLRDLAGLVPDALRARLVGELDLNPLPTTFTYVQDGPGANQSRPMTVTIDSSHRVDLVADAQLFEKGSGAACGDHGTACARLAITDIPEHIGATIGKRVGALAGNIRDNDTAVDLELIPTTNPTVKPDVAISAAVGLPADIPVVAEAPLFADLTLVGAPRYVSVKLDGVETVRSVGSALEVTSSAVERFQFHACKRDYPNEQCAAGTAGKIDLVELSARTFDLRPSDFPAPPATTAPLYLGVAGRGRNLEAVVRIPDISEVQFVDRDGVTAAKARVGGTTSSTSNPLQVRVDIEDLPLPGLTLPLGAITVANPVVDLLAAVDVTPFPGEATVCIRQPGRDLSLDSGVPFASTCDDDQPFGTGTADAIDHSPLSLGFTASTQFAVTADVDATVDGTDADTGKPIEPQRIVGSLELAGIPTELAAHVYEPAHVATAKGPKLAGPMRARVRMPGNPVPCPVQQTSCVPSGPDLTFSAAYLVGARAVCEDARPTVSALCVSGRIEDLPTSVDLRYDPDLDLAYSAPNSAQATNLHVVTAGPTVASPSTDVDDLRISSVKPKRLPDGSLASPAASDVLVVTADMDPLPNPFAVRGTLDLPDTPDDPPTAQFEVLNGQTLPRLVAHVRNYVAPDPTAGAFVPARPMPTNGLGTDTISVIQRGEALRLDADISKLQAGGLRAVFTANPNASPAPGDPLYVPIGTTALGVRFGEDRNVRAFLDLQPSAQERTLADVLLEQLPAAIDICLRGPRPAALATASPVTGTGTWCDNAVTLPPGERPIADGDGAVELFGQPHTKTNRIDVDAFVRVLSAGGSDVVAARIDVNDLPQVMRLMLPADPSAGAGSTLPNAPNESLRFTSWRSNSLGMLVPEGIGEITAHAASFDLPDGDTPYSGTGLGPRPYTVIPVATGPFPVRAAVAGQYLHAAASIATGDFDVRAHLGGPNKAGSQLRQAVYGLHPCPAPPTAPADYPRFPNDASQYTCVRVMFEPSDTDVDPLSLHADVHLGTGELVRLRDGGLSDLPEWFQVTMAETEPFLDPAKQRGWRRPCQANATEPANASCMPPLLRFDQPNNPVVFGVAEFGRPADLASTTQNDKEIDDFTPASGTAPSFTAVPTATGWDGAFDDGVRVKVIDYDGGTPTSFGDDRLAVRAAFRLAIPRSLTVDQLQTYDAIDGTLKTEASDFRFHAVIREPCQSNPNQMCPVSSIGELAAMVQQADSKAQVLLTQPCPAVLVDRKVAATAVSCPTERARGVPIPGEVGLNMFMRKKQTPIAPDKARGSTFIQLDGRISTEMNLGVQVRAGGVEVADGVTLGYVDASIRGIPEMTAAQQADPKLPSFRVRTEILSDYPTTTTTPTWGLNLADLAVDVDSAAVDIDLSPNAALGGCSTAPAGSRCARLVDAVIFTDGGVKMAADVAAWDQPLQPGAGAAEVSFAFSAAVDPLDLTLRSVVDFPDVTFSQWGDEVLGAPGWLKAVLNTIAAAAQWFVNNGLKVLQAVLNALPLEIKIRSRLAAQFSLTKVSRFTLRLNLLHAFAEMQGSGSASVGPLNLDLDEFHAAFTFRQDIDIPSWIDWCCPPPAPDVPDRLIIQKLLIGIEYDENDVLFGTQRVDTVLGPNLLLDMRDCGDIVTQLLPLSGNLQSLALNTVTLPTPVTLKKSMDFLLWPFTDPRVNVSGALVPMYGGKILNHILDLIGGPLLCNLAAAGVFAVDSAAFSGVGINYATGDPDAYNPGNFATVSFHGHPVPGQPSHQSELPLEQNGAVLVTQPAPSPPVKQVSSGPPAAPSPPAAPAALYSGPTTTISQAISLCGVHEFSALTVNNHITVSPSVDTTAVPWGSAQRCPQGSQGRLELRANTMVVNGPAGKIVADGASDDVPAEVGPADYRATGSSGGTNAGVGFVGSAPDSGTRPYEQGTVDTQVYPGGPGSKVPAGYTDPDITGTITPAGDGGKGGGAIVLKADTSLTVSGTISANGLPGASGSAGACDSNEFEDPANDTVIRDSAGNVVKVVPVSDDPPYEHTGTHGSGGGAGGGIALQARGTVNLSGVSLSATGGNGGDGQLGAGGGGGGGAIKVLAPHQVGVTRSTLATKVVAGVNGSLAPGGVGPCPGVNPTATPVDDDGNAQSSDGVVVIEDRPVATLLPHEPFWRAGAGTAKVKAWFAGAAGPQAATVVVCAARLAATTAPANAGVIATKLGVTPPTVTAPCGSTATGFTNTVQELSVGANRHTFTGSVKPQDAAATFDIVPSGSGYYGLYTTAIRARTAGNDCFNPNDLGGLNDTVDCAVEPFGGIEWIIGVDASAPTVSITSPAAGSGVTDPVITLGLTVADQPSLSGPAFAECHVTGDDDAGGNPVYRFCNDGDTFELLGGAGTNTIEVRAYDRAGNRTVATRSVVYQTNAPAATATLSSPPPTAQQGWYKNPPSITLASNDPLVAQVPGLPTADLFAWRFDNGVTFGCTTNPCTIPATEVAKLGDGEHVLHYTAIDRLGNRWFDDADLNTDSPMPTTLTSSAGTHTSFKLDRTAPAVALAAVPRAAHTLAGDPWFDEQPFVVVSAVDRFGGSGVVSREYRLKASGTWTTWTPTATPPLALEGEHEVCVRATDAADNTSAPVCETLRVDSLAPSLTLTPSVTPNASTGWYTAAAPTFTVGGYNDGSGVGAATNRFRTRYDNVGFTDCDPPCTVSPSFATGRHLVHASAADRFGNRSAEITLQVPVDLQPPVTTALVTPPVGGGANGWWVDKPWVTLVSLDPGRPWGTASGSGVARIEYTLGGPGGTYVPYTDSFEVSSAGAHVLCVRATDVAGNQETAHCQNLFVDLHDPVTTQTPSGAPGAAGWYTSPLTVTVAATDAVPGSGVDPAGVLVSVDRGPFVTVSGAITIGEGVHLVRAFSVDRAGRRSEMIEATYRVDLSAPVVAIRTVPAAPESGGWFRRTADVVLEAGDGTGNSGVVSLEYSLDGVTWKPYTAPVPVGEGVRTVQARALDAAGRQGTAQRQLRVDVTPPVVRATSPSPMVWARTLLGPKTAKLQWEVTENLSGPVRMAVVIYDATGNPVRRLDGGWRAIVPGQKLVGFTEWDGKNGTVTALVPIGVYYYRVTAIDAAGTIAFSGESKPIQITV